MAEAQQTDPEVQARIEARRAYGLLFCVLAVICVLAAFAGPLLGVDPWPAVVMFFGCLAAGGFLSTADISAFSSVIKPPTRSS